MVDIVNPATRSRMMRGIRGKNTKPERQIRSLLHRCGFRFRLHPKDLPGKPDIVLPRLHAIVFVHGCFWHGHSCTLFRLPGTRQEFWQEKIDRNRMNDRRSESALKTMGWRVCTVWECALRGRAALSEAELAEKMTIWLRSEAATLELTAAENARIT